MTYPSDRHLGLVIYCWGLDEQTRLLVECLAPLVTELRNRWLKRFWFDRFDARGPHVFALFTVPAERLALTTSLAEQRLKSYLMNQPSVTELSRDELEARHRGCRGAALCEVDAEAGLAANNTLRFCEQPAERYPFSLAQGLTGPERLFDLLDELTGWSLAQLACQPAGSAPIALAVRWLANLFDVLPDWFEDPQAYWRFHTATLVRRIAFAVDHDELILRVTRSVGESNDAVLTRLWKRARSAPPAWPALSQLVQVLAGADEARGPQRHRLLREIVHVTMRQLGVPARLEIVLLLFCWRESLKEVAELNRPQTPRGGRGAVPRE